LQAAGHHVAVTDGLDALEAALLAQFVEAAEDAVEHLEDLDFGAMPLAIRV
jgi:hypothetical protein